jgi:hypothetical protein
VLPALLASPP